MNPGMNSESCAIEQTIAFYHFTSVAHQQQVGHSHLLEGASHRIHPKMIGELRISHSDMTRHALVKTELTEQA